MTTTITWTRPENLATADAWAAYQTVMAILAERGETPTAESIKLEAANGRSWALTQADHICDRWAPAYALVMGAVS